MATKKKPTPKKAKKKKRVIYPLYFQASNPSKKVLAWLEEQLEYRVVYFQSGKPSGGGCVPGQPGCQ